MLTGTILFCKPTTFYLTLLVLHLVAIIVFHDYHLLQVSETAFSSAYAMFSCFQLSLVDTAGTL